MSLIIFILANFTFVSSTFSCKSQNRKDIQRKVFWNPGHLQTYPSAEDSLIGVPRALITASHTISYHVSLLSDFPLPASSQARHTSGTKGTHYSNVRVSSHIGVPKTLIPTCITVPILCFISSGFPEPRSHCPPHKQKTTKMWYSVTH